MCREGKRLRQSRTEKGMVNSRLTLHTHDLFKRIICRVAALKDFYLVGSRLRIDHGTDS